MENITLKAAAANVFNALNSNRDDRERNTIVDATLMVRAVRGIIEQRLEDVKEGLANFNIDHWMLSDECGSAVLVLRDITGAAAAQSGELYVVMKETGEIWVRIRLDKVSSVDGFEHIFLEGHERNVISQLNELVSHLLIEHELAGLSLNYHGKDLVKSEAVSQ